MATHTLNNGKLKLVVNETGGCIDALQYINGREFDVLRPKVNVKSGFAGDASMFPMVPMANRIRQNQFIWQSREVKLPVNTAVDDQFFLHGNGWTSDWHLIRKSTHDNFLTMGLESKIAGVCHYQAKLSYHLNDGALIAIMELTNLGEEAFPFGAGFHPFFSMTKQTQVKFSAKGFWFEDSDHLPQEFVKNIPSEFDFSMGKPVSDAWINNGYQMDEQGVSVLLEHNNGLSVAITSPCHYLQLYKPAGDRHFLCIEPQSHYVNAHNCAQESLHILAAKQSMRICMRIQVSAD